MPRRSPTITARRCCRTSIARRPTEIDALNGGIVRFGRECGVPTPLNEAIVALIQGMEHSWTSQPESSMTDPARTPSATEIARRYANARAAMAEHDADALLVCGSEYSGFEGAVRYLSGFRIVHRYAYVLLPARRRSRSRSSRARRAGSATTPTAGSTTRSSPSIPGHGSATTCARRASAGSPSTASTT